MSGLARVLVTALLAAPIASAALEPSASQATPQATGGLPPLTPRWCHCNPAPPQASSPYLLCYCLAAPGDPQLPAQPPAAAPAPASPPRPEVSRERRVHDGLFLRLGAGVGPMTSSASDGDSSLRVTGIAGQLSVALGGALTRSLVVAGEAWTITVPWPRVGAGDTRAPTTDTFTLAAAGLNVTYYFLPSNVYLTAVPSTSTLSPLTRGGYRGGTRPRLAIRLAIGKEWWVSDEWGLGLNLQYAYSYNGDGRGSPRTWNTSWAGVGLSATYN